MNLSSTTHLLGNLALWVCPAIGMLFAAWITQRFAPEAQGHGIPEVIVAVARRDGIIRPRVSIIKIIASGVTIGTGGSVGREGPIVQIGASLGSLVGQRFKLTPENIKVLVAAGGAAGISATFNAPIAGVIFASEIILGNFAVESLTPIVIASVLADVVQAQVGPSGWGPLYSHLHYRYEGVWEQLPTYMVLGLICGLAAVGFTKLLYWIEDVGLRRFRTFWARAIVFGLLVGVAGVVYENIPPSPSAATLEEIDERGQPIPPLLGSGEGVINHALYLENADKPSSVATLGDGEASEKFVRLDRDQMWEVLWWLIPLALLKPLVTSLSLGGGGSGGIFAPSLFLGATTGASFGLLCNLFIPGWAANPGVYAVVGMGAVVAGTTHGTLSAILIVYELTSDYRIILPIMIAAGLSSLVARLVDPESIYDKKLSKRGESIQRGHDLHRVEHIMVRDVMIRHFPSVRSTDDLAEIVRVARANSQFESLPVMDAAGKLTGIIRPVDLHRVLDSNIPAHLVKAEEIALRSPISVSPDENLLEALRDFGTRDVETLPVETGIGERRKLVGLLLRSEVMRRYREEMLRV